MTPLTVLLVFSIATVSCDNLVVTSLPDSQRLDTVYFLGTQDSAYHGITRQLDIGVRVLHTSVRRTDDAFALHFVDHYLGLMFGDVVRVVEAYLQEHPEELVIMMMQQNRDQWLLWRNWFGKSMCDILQDKYLKEWPILVQQWSFNDTIGQHRGKILLAAVDDVFAECLPKNPTDSLQILMTRILGSRPEF